MSVLHEFIDAGALNEPGISDIDEGRWARYRAVCAKCGESRDVWSGLTLSELNWVGGACPKAGSGSPGRPESRIRAIFRH